MRAKLAALLFIAMTASESFGQEPSLERETESLPDHLIYIYANQNEGTKNVGEQLLAQDKRWVPGDQLKVCFFGGNPIVRAMVADIASEWNKYSSVKFDFGKTGTWRNCNDTSAGFSQVRVGFGERGYWSAIGVDSNNLLNAMQPSLNLGGFDVRYGPFQPAANGGFLTPNNVVGSIRPYDKGVILHEFGHALGLMHEHQNPNLNCYSEIKWEGAQTAYTYYAGSPNFWDKQKVDFNVGKGGLAYVSILAGKPDPSSIMMYAQPAEIFREGTNSKCYVKGNDTLSELDKAFISEIYAPSKANQPVPFEASSPLPALSASIASSKSGQKDILARVNADLLSDATSVRREARRQLASLLQSSQSPELAYRLVKEAENTSYRHQLGVATALANTSLPFEKVPYVKADIIAQIKKMKLKNNDPSLNQSFVAAVMAVEQKSNEIH